MIIFIDYRGLIMRIKTNGLQKVLGEVNFKISFRLLENQSGVWKICCNFIVGTEDGTCGTELFPPAGANPYEYRSVDDGGEFMTTVGKELNALIENENLPFQFQLESFKYGTGISTFLTIQKKVNRDEKSNPEDPQSELLSTRLTRADIIKLYEFLNKHNIYYSYRLSTQMDFVLHIEFLNEYMLKLPKEYSPKILWTWVIKPKLPKIYEHNRLLKEHILTFFNQQLGESLGGARVALTPIIEYAEAGVPELDEKKFTQTRVNLPIQSEELFIAFGKIIDNTNFKSLHDKLAIGWTKGHTDRLELKDIIPLRKTSRSAHYSLGKMFCEAVNGKTPDSIPADLISELSQFEEEFYKRDLLLNHEEFASAITDLIRECFNLVTDIEHPDEEDVDSIFSCVSENNITDNFMLLTLNYLQVLKEFGITIESVTKLGITADSYLPDKLPERRTYIRAHYLAKEKLLELDKLHMQAVEKIQQQKPKAVVCDLKHDEKEQKQATSSAAALISMTSPIYTSSSSAAANVTSELPKADEIQKENTMD